MKAQSKKADPSGGPRRAATPAHSLIERVFGALEWLAMHPPYSLDPIHAHEYWLVEEAWLAPKDN